MDWKPWLPSLSLLLLLVLVMSSCAQEQDQELLQEKLQQYTMLHEWVKKQRPAGGAGCTCGKKDAALLAAEANRVIIQVDPGADTTITDPSAYVKTIGEAIAKIPDGNTKRHIITLQYQYGTVYREKVFLGRSKPFVTFASAHPTIPVVIAWNDTAATLGKDGKPLGEQGSSSVTIESDYFIATGIVFRNDAPPPEEKRGDKGAGKIIALSAGNMAPALRVVGSKATFYKCAVEGGQGALYDQKGLHYYKSCTINGTVDFIFGNARSFYEDCNLVSTFGSGLSGLPEAKPPLTKLPPPAADGGGGFSFKTCNISGESFVYLGRVGWPTVYSYTDVQKIFFPLIVDGDKFELYNEELTPYFHIAFRNYGDYRVSYPSAIQLNYAEASPFLGTHFVSGDYWILAIPPALGMDD